MRTRVRDRAATLRRKEAAAAECRLLAQWFRGIAQDYAAAHELRKDLPATGAVTADRIDLLHGHAGATETAEQLERKAARLEAIVFYQGQRGKVGAA